MVLRVTSKWISRALLVSCLSLYVSQTALAEYKRGYVDTRIGQIHFYQSTPGVDVSPKTPIVFFHASPRSGQLYENVVKEMGRDRVAIALDTPGFGGSDAFQTQPTLENIAQVMAEALKGLGYGESAAGKVDVFGFHTGSLTVTELALTYPELVRRVVIGGIPLRSKEDRKIYFDNVSRGEPIDEEKLQYAWDSMIEFRDEGVTFGEAASAFSENVRALTGPYWHAYHAVWAYPLEERIQELEGPTLVMNYPNDTEYDPTLEAYRNLLKNASYVELPEISNTYHPFNPGQNPQVWARELRKWLDVPVKE